MTYPVRFPYMPDRAVTRNALYLALGLAVLAALPDRLQLLPRRACIWGAAIASALWLPLVFARTAWRREIVIDADGVTVPDTGPRRRSTRIPYAEIENIADPEFPWTIRTHGREYGIAHLWIPGDRLAEFEATLAEAAGPALRVRLAAVPDAVDDGWNWYIQDCSYEGHGAVRAARLRGDGVVHAGNADVVLAFTTRHRIGRTVSLLCSAPLAYRDAAGTEVATVRRAHRLPPREYVLHADGAPAVTVRQTGMLRTRYAARFADGRTWDFRLPLFTTRYRGTASDGGRIEMQMQAHTCWVWRVERRADSAWLPAVVALLHREKVNS